MTRNEALEEPEFGRAATDLAIAAADLRDADDRLVALGRELRNTDAARGMPWHVECERALDACGEVSMAHLHMRRAEENYERQRERVRGPMPT